MPTVDEVYKGLVASGYTAKDAAKEAQKRTGMSTVTGKPIKPKQLKFSNEGVTYGQQDTFKKRGKNIIGILS